MLGKLLVVNKSCTKNSMIMLNKTLAVDRAHIKNSKIMLSKTLAVTVRYPTRGPS